MGALKCIGPLVEGCELETIHYWRLGQRNSSTRIHTLSPNYVM